VDNEWDTEKIYEMAGANCFWQGMPYFDRFPEKGVEEIGLVFLSTINWNFALTGLS